MEDVTQDELTRLLGNVAQQDREALAALYERVSGRMFGLCRTLAGQQELAEEALQDTFIRIWHHAGEYHSGRGSPLSWMMTIARYRTLDLMRARKVRRGPGDDALDMVEDGRKGPFESSLKREQSQVLDGCLEELSQSQRDTIELSYFRGYTHDDLATFLNTPVGTVKSWIRRGLLALKRCLEQ